MKKHLSLRWFTAFLALIMCVLSMPIYAEANDFTTVIDDETFPKLFHQSAIEEMAISINCSSEREKVIDKIEKALQEEPSRVTLKDGGLFNKDYYAITATGGSYLYYGKKKNNKPDGFGVLTYIHMNGFSGVVSNYLVYAGNFKDGLYNGYGAKFAKPSDELFDGYDPIKHGSYVTYDGEWKDGEKNGKGNWFLSTYDPYELLTVVVGEFKKNKANGKVKEYTKGILTYDGATKNGDKNGKGISYFSNGQTKYSGEWKDGVYHGKGKLYRENGDLIYSGKWKNGDYAS